MSSCVLQYVRARKRNYYTCVFDTISTISENNGTRRTDMTEDTTWLLGHNGDMVLYCGRVMPPDALQSKAYCTNPGL